MNCKNCGNEIRSDDNDKFCSKCGQSIDIFNDKRLKLAEKKIDVHNIVSGVMVGIGVIAAPVAYGIKQIIIELAKRENITGEGLNEVIEMLNYMDMMFLFSILLIAIGMVDIVYIRYSWRVNVLRGDFSFLE